MNDAKTSIGRIRSFTCSGQEVTFDTDGGCRVQLTILADDLLRVRIAPEGRLTPNISRAVTKTDWPATPFSLIEHDDAVTIATRAMRIMVRRKPLLIECRDASGELVLEEDLDCRTRWSERETRVSKRIQPGEKHVGLGWRPLGLVRTGTTFRLRNKATYDDPDVFYAGIPLWYGLRDGRAYALFFDDVSQGTIDLGATDDELVSFANLGGPLDYYYFAGPTMARILDRYTELTGRPFMPPRWALGYHQCRWSYTPQSQMIEIAEELRRRKLPADVIYLDIDYMPAGHALSFDAERFPDPAGLVRRLHDMGFKVIANISPLLLRDDPKCAEAEKSGYLLRRADGETLWGNHFYWVKFRGNPTGDVVWLDFSNSAACDWWSKQHQSFLDIGIDGIWNDLNEPDELGGEWPADVQYDYDGQPVDHERTSTQYPLLQTAMSYETLEQHAPDRRPYVISRGGCAGIQRYAALWTGDNQGDWDHDFRRNIAMGLSLSISGNPNNGHDIGGFFGHPTHDDAPSAELYCRWMQAGVFNPYCRQHRDGFGNLADPPRPFTEPWRFGDEVETICRSYLELRYRLMPYLYTLFHRAHVSGEPIQRPTLFDFPGDPRTLEQNDDFMFGPWMLISPVTQPGAETWPTYLPAGTDWIDWWDDKLYSGGRTVETATPPERIPIFVRAGAIISTAPVVQYEGERAIEMLTLDLYPGPAVSEFTLYEDDGISWEYRDGAFCETCYQLTPDGHGVKLDISARNGSYTPAARSYEINIHRVAASSSPPTLDGEPLPVIPDRDALSSATTGYMFNADAQILTARFPDAGRAMSLICA